MMKRARNLRSLLFSRIRASVNVINSSEQGSAMVIALMVMILLMGFVALAVSRTNSETVASANDEAETKAFEAANASLEIMTRNFNKVFETKLTFSTTDETRIESQLPPGFDTIYDFTQTITQTQATKDVILTGEFFQGLNARRDEWQLDTVAQHKQNGVQVALRRKFLNNRVPIFQFGIFYDDDLEFHPGPRFDFGGRVHSNGSLFLQAGDGVYFSSKVSTANHVFTDVSKNGSPWTNWDDDVYIKNASGNYVQLQYNMGSVLNTVVNGAPVTTSPLPTAYKSNNWKTNSNLFQGNLLANTKPLQLPIKLNSDITGTNLDMVEVVKRGKNVGDVYNDGTGTVSAPDLSAVTEATSDDKVTAAERYYNKTGIRVSLADSKVKLPGCATTMATAVTTPCGIRLDGDSTGLISGPITGPRGYVPRAMQGTPAYQATKVNGDRFNTGGGRETWIKIETVVYNAATIAYDTQDITQDILALGLTDPPPANTTFSITDANYNTNLIDRRAIINIQRYVIEGPNLPNTGYVSAAGSGATAYNYVTPGTVSASATSCATATTGFTSGGDTTQITGSPNYFPGNFISDHRSSMRNATVLGGLGAGRTCVVPFPINMFDTREGLYNDTSTVFSPTASYGANVPWAGVMSMIDIDVANLRAFLNGTYDTRMPTGTPYAIATGHVLRSTDIPQTNGWVFYVSDRRGDFDFDGEYDMEDIYGNNDGIRQDGEDVNRNGTLQADFSNEAVRYTGTGSNISGDIAAVFDHKFYRRGVRLVNGTLPPGGYNATTPANTKGIAFATENGIYVQGNFNATGISSVGTPTAANLYLPQGTNNVPASVTADSITILSNAWTDGASFVYPFSLRNRVASETTQRFAMLAGDTLTTLNGTPNQGGGDPRLNGGVHNFLRFLEQWGTRFNYSGSLINLFNSHNNNGAFKCCNNVYDPPERNWVFDATFLDVNRLPPGTPYFQNIQITGFQRVN
ncbi:MAG: pilus assembly PilX N-terminal domain-containing protein [Pyrinomonadaceae bacterium]|nr:pilus assembly PilX N-terminal domain-containing protein [Acidobacteriota bacterium]MBP7376012.1 pilus assembly PilX N-terminal domain-containing protein [Pyrinomonadaceae bacterium]